MRQRIFVGSSREAVEVCRAVQRELDQDFDVTVWDQDVFGPTHGALESLLAELDSSDAGIFVVRGDDMTAKRDRSESTVRDNVIFELGLYIGRLGRDRAFMLSPEEDRAALPSDLRELTMLPYDAVRFEREKRAAVGAACSTIRDRLEKLQAPVALDSPLRQRLDRAMKRMSRDLERLLSEPAAPSRGGGDARPLAELPISIGRAMVRIELGRIEEQELQDDSTAGRHRATGRAALSLRRDPGRDRSDEREWLTSLVMPVFGSGHGVMPLRVALLFNLLALRSTLDDEIGDRVRDVRIVVFERQAGGVDQDALRDVISRVAER